MTSREHARRLMLILLSSEGRAGRDAPDAPGAERDEDRSAREGRDEPADGESRRMALVEALAWT